MGNLLVRIDSSVAQGGKTRPARGPARVGGRLRSMARRRALPVVRAGRARGLRSTSAAASGRPAAWRGGGARSRRGGFLGMETGAGPGGPAPVVGSSGSCALAADDELAAAVPLPGRLVVTLDRGLGLAVAHSVDLGGGDAAVDQVLLHGARTALAEREVVLLAAALVAVALDRDHLPARVRADRPDVLLEQHARVALERGAVVVEVDGLEQPALAVRVGHRGRGGAVVELRGPSGRLDVVFTARRRAADRQRAGC